MKALNVAAVLLVASFSPVSAAADVQELVKLGQTSIYQKEFEQAVSYFDQALKDTQESDDKDWYLRIMFYRGNARLVQAEQLNLNSELLNEARNNFELVLKKKPDSGSTMVNLARVYGYLGKTDQAEKLYHSAINLGDKKQGLYRQQYASYLADKEPRESVKQLQFALYKNPTNSYARERLVKAYLKPENSEGFADFLHEQIDQGQILSSLDSATLALADKDWPARRKTELLVVVARALSNQFSSPDQFENSDIYQRLQIAGDTVKEIRPGVNELINTYTQNRLDTDYSWWQRSSGNDRSSRTKVMSELISSRAQWYRQNDQPTIAEKMYLNAVSLGEQKNPEAILDLVNFYSEEQKLDKVQEISDKYESLLFVEKGQAYSEGDLQEIYKYHRTLARIYTLEAEKTGDYGNASNPRSAAFQLSHAYDSATQLDSIVPDADLVNSLAKSLESNNKTRDAIEIRKNALDLYKDLQDTKNIKLLVEQLDERTLEAIEKY